MRRLLRCHPLRQLHLPLLPRSDPSRVRSHPFSSPSLDGDGHAAAAAAAEQIDGAVFHMDGAKRLSDSVLHHVYARLGIPLPQNVSALPPDVTETQLLDKIHFLRKIGFDNQRLSRFATRQPPLLALDLVQRLSPFLLRLQSFGLKRTLLRKLLNCAPFVTGNLSELPFEENVQTLKDLHFSASQIETILKRLSCRAHRFVRFARFPLENPRSTLTSFENLGLEKEQARHLVTTYPSLFFFDVESNIETLRTILGDGKSVAKLVLSRAEILKCNHKDLKETVEYMTGLIEKDTLSVQVGEKPKTLFLKKPRLQTIVKFLERFGLDKKSALALAIKRPYLVDVGSKRLQTYADVLQSNGLDSEHILKLMEVNPRIFESSIASLTAKLAVFKDRGFEGEDLKELLSCHPAVLTYSLERITSKLDFLENLAIAPQGSSILKSVIIKTARIKQNGFQSRIDWLRGLGIPNDEVLEMVRKLPSILVMGDDRIQKKIDYLVNIMGYPVQELVSAPTFLCCSLKTKIEPRHRLISWLKSSALLERNPPLFSFVELEESFKEQFVDPYPEALLVYKGDSEAERVDESNCT